MTPTRPAPPTTRTAPAAGPTGGAQSILATRLRGAAAAFALALLTSGIPVLLIRIGAHPIPDTMPDPTRVWQALTRPDDGTAVITAITLIAWVAWLVIAVSIVLELIGAVRGIPAPRLPGLALPQHAARHLVATAALLFTALPTATTTAPPPHGATAATATTVATSTLTPVVRTPPTASHPTAAQAAATGPTPVAAATPPTPPTARTIRHTVKPGDSLWSIAAHHLGSGTAWHRIADANRDLLGDRPGFLTPGMVLHIPTTTTTAATAPPSAGTGRHTAAPGPSETAGAQDGSGRVHRHTPDGRHIVQDGDTLSGIAAADLGDASAWPQLAADTADTVQPDGRHLVDPDLIYTGWTITLPGHATTDPAPAPVPAPAPPAAPSKPRTPPPPTATPDDHHRTPIPAPIPAPVAPGPGTSIATPPGSAIPPTAAPVPASPAPHDPATTADPEPFTTTTDDDPSIVTAPVLMAGAGFLTGSLLLLLRRRRRDQFRARRPGRTIAVPPPDLIPLEKDLSRTGTRYDRLVDAIDQSLRALAADRATTGTAMPALAAVEAIAHTITIHLSEPATLPAPWHDPDTTGMRWQLTLTDLDAREPLYDDTQPAPYPLLLTIGHGPDDTVWLLNSEEFGAFTITGPPTRVLDLARHIAADIATAPWTGMARAHCIGIGAEAATMDPRRLAYHHETHTATPEIARLLTDTIDSLDRATDEHIPDTATARATQTGDDIWPARLLLLNTHPTAADKQDAADPSPDTSTGDTPTAENPAQTALRALIATITDHPHRTGSVVLIAGTSPLAPTVLHIDDTGTLTVTGVDLQLTAAALTADEATGCAALLACAEDLGDVPVPDMPDETGWHTYTNAAGAIRHDHTLPRHTTPDPDRPTTTVLEGPDAVYLERAATNEDDLTTLAPHVPDTVRERLEVLDPDLEADLADWADPTSPRPKLTLLGPVELRTQPGTTIPTRIGFHTDLAAYLATHPHGVTGEEAAEAFQITTSRIRSAMNHLRHWLGTDPATGDPYLPMATKSPAGRARGQGIYQITGILTDADLFRRLRARGQARGQTDGHTDLHRALTLVTGPPFTHLRPGGWFWLLEDRLDHHLTVAIVDVAHTVTAQALAHGDTTTARYATETAILAAPHEDTPRLDLAAITAAEGKIREAHRIVHEQITNRGESGEPPADLTQRTQGILETHGWVTTARRRHSA